MKIYLDDMRELPKGFANGWVIARSYDKFIELITWAVENEFTVQESITDISFDHDLGEEKTGFDCLKWFLEYADSKELDLSELNITFHTANTVGRMNMKSLWNTYRKVNKF